VASASFLKLFRILRPLRAVNGLTRRETCQRTVMIKSGSKALQNYELVSCSFDSILSQQPRRPSGECLFPQIVSDTAAAARRQPRAQAQGARANRAGIHAAAVQSDCGARYIYIYTYIYIYIYIYMCICICVSVIDDNPNPAPTTTQAWWRALPS